MASGKHQQPKADAAARGPLRSSEYYISVIAPLVAVWVYVMLMLLFVV